MHYTGKPRDIETNLDYFGARYYSSGMARWMSPDWADKPTAVPYANFGDPQSLNLYGYVTSNPVSKQDDDGHHLRTLQEEQSAGSSSTQPYTPGGFSSGGDDGGDGAQQAQTASPQSGTAQPAAATPPASTQDGNGSPTARATQAAEGALNIGLAEVKFDASVGAATAAETGVGACVAAYGAISASGSFTAGVVQEVGAATGQTTLAERGAEAVTTVTSISGFGTLLKTGSLDKAATAAAFEGIITSNPKDLAKGGTASRIAKGADLLDNIHTVVEAGKSQMTNLMNKMIELF